VLGAVGESEEPVSPATLFSALIGSGGDPTFLGGAVQPMTLRSMAATLLAKWRVFGPLKHSRLFGDAKTAHSAGTRRRLQSPIARPVPDSVVSPATNATRTSSTGERGSAVGGGVPFADLMIDLRDLIARGLTDEEFARRLELGGSELVAECRHHSEELQALSR
jgi:hypothetical protein